MMENRPKNKKKKWIFVFWLIFFLILIIGFLAWFFILRFYEYTDDAYIEGNKVFVTPLQSGFIKSIYTDDSFLVTKGQLLFELNATDTTIQYNQSQKKLAQVVREVCELYHQAFAYQSEIQMRKAELVKKAQDYAHRQGVVDIEGVSLEEFEHAEADYLTSYHQLQMTQQLYNKTVSLIQGTSIKNHPLVLSSSADFINLWVQQSRNKIYAPVEGLVAQRNVQVGMWVKAGTPLLSVIPLNQIWINANFKETQLKKMRIGQKARITSDLYGHKVVFHGKIVGLPGAAGNAFSLLPPQNLSGNWIKIVQRLPVRIELDLDEIKKYPLRLGLSMKVIVDLHDQQGELVPISNKGPSYETAIFDEEEKGAVEAINQIIKENIDPLLEDYFTSAFLVEPMTENAN